MRIIRPVASIKASLEFGAADACVPKFQNDLNFEVHDEIPETAATEARDRASRWLAWLLVGRPQGRVGLAFQNKAGKLSGAITLISLTHMHFKYFNRGNQGFHI